MAYLVMLLAGLSVGLWPAAVHPPQQPLGALLPALQAVAAAQAAFLVLVYPVVLCRRAGRPGTAGSRAILPLLIEGVVMMVVAFPFYAAAAYLSDATASDAARAALYIVTLWPLAWAAGAAMPRWPSLTLIVLLLAGLALPATWYIARDFVAGTPSSQWLWELGPLTAAWHYAASRQPLAPSPVWPLLLWPAIAAALAVLSPQRAQRTQRNP